MVRKQDETMAADGEVAEAPRRHGATVHDVARHAGVSSMTVSRVVNGGKGVRPNLRQKVEVALRELNYVPNLAARAARSGTIKLGVLFSNPRSSNLGEFLMGAFAESARLGCQLVIEPTAGHPRGIDAVRKIVGLGVDGLVLPPPLCDDMEAMEILWNAQVPALSFATADSRSYSSSVSIDDFAGARCLTRHLLELGHRDIAFVRGDPLHSTARGREEGFRAAMAEAGAITPGEYLVGGDFTYRSGLTVGRELLDGEAKGRPSAIFASNDDMAAAILAVAHGLGIRVPGQLSVAGFDDTPIASTVWPQLTTVHQPLAQMASAAIEILFGMARQRRAGERIETHHRRCEFTLQVRGSTGPPK
jgi:LacI family transcriptional regulator